MKSYISFSGGKDSTAMLLKFHDLGLKYDEAVFADTDFEYPELYTYIEYLEKRFDYIKIKVLKTKTFKAKELFDKNNMIRSKLINDGIVCVGFENVYPKDWNENTVITLWDFWFYGMVCSGTNAGTIRSYPLALAPCWYRREAKVKPLQTVMKDADIINIGIAIDEVRRHNVSDDRVRHPLIDFKMSELDCATYLKKKGLHNPIYDKYNRSGCFQCPKQNEWGLYMQWKNSPELWEVTKFYDNEARRLRKKGGFIDRKTKKEIKIYELEEKFIAGFVPDNNLKFVCHSCSLSDIYDSEECNDNKVKDVMEMKE